MAACPRDRTLLCYLFHVLLPWSDWLRVHHHVLWLIRCHWPPWFDNVRDSCLPRCQSQYERSGLISLGEEGKKWCVHRCAWATACYSDSLQCTWFTKNVTLTHPQSSSSYTYNKRFKMWNLNHTRRTNLTPVYSNYIEQLLKHSSRPFLSCTKASQIKNNPISKHRTLQCCDV